LKAYTYEERNTNDMMSHWALPDLVDPIKLMLDDRVDVIAHNDVQYVDNHAQVMKQVLKK
jgi:hypothetical protein